MTVVDGNPGFNRVVVLEYPSMATLRSFYHGPQYAPPIALRQSCAVSHVALVEGYEA